MLRRRVDAFNAPSLSRAAIKKLAVMPSAKFLARPLLWLLHIYWSKSKLLADLVSKSNVALGCGISAITYFN